MSLLQSMECAGREGGDDGSGQLMLLTERQEMDEAVLPAGGGWAWNGAWADGGRLPKAEVPGLLLKASKLAKPPWEGVWPTGGEDTKTA